MATMSPSSISATCFWRYSPKPGPLILSLPDDRLVGAIVGRGVVAVARPVQAVDPALEVVDAVELEHDVVLAALPHAHHRDLVVGASTVSATATGRETRTSTLPVAET